MPHESSRPLGPFAGIRLWSFHVKRILSPDNVAIKSCSFMPNFLAVLRAKDSRCSGVSTAGTGIMGAMLLAGEANKNNVAKATPIEMAYRIGG